MTNNSAMIVHSPTKKDVCRLTKKTANFPKMVVINSTYQCNAKCIHCPYTNSKIRKEERARLTPSVTEKVFKTIADQVGAHKAFLRVSGAGEPFLNKNIVEYIMYAKEKKCQVGVITNGSLATEKKIRPLLEAGIEMIEFSADAGDSATYAKIRRGLDFENMVKNIKKAVELRNRLGSKTNIIASVVNQKLLEGKLENTVKFWEAIADTVQVRKYLTWDINNINDSGDTTPYLNTGSPCPFPFDRILTDTNGDVRFCVYDIKGKTKWGNVLETPLSDIWKGENFTWLRKIHRESKFSKMEICNKCLDRQFRSWEYNYFYLKDKASEHMAKQ